MLPPQVSTALNALSSVSSAETGAAAALATGLSGGAVNPGLGQVLDLSV
jgi:hypothetical protein